MRGIRHIVFFGLPHFAELYAELLNMMDSQTDITCTVMYCAFDALRLEQVVGTARAHQMLAADKHTHLFM